jgi:phosphoketolase
MVENTRPLGKFLRDVVAQNPNNFRVFGPDETASNKLDNIYEATKKVWWGEFLPEDLDGSELAREGRVMEMLSEHALEGWLETYTLSGRHGFFSTYESFVHVIDSMVNQHAKWLAKCNEIPWRADVPSLNILITSTVWRQDHNGFTHQDPGFLDVIANKSADVVRIYMPPDVNTLLSTAAHCLRAKNYVNVVDLFRLQPESEHPHELNDRAFDSLFPTDKPVVFNFHGYPTLIHRLTYRRTNHDKCPGIQGKRQYQHPAGIGHHQQHRPLFHRDRRH